MPKQYWSQDPGQCYNPATHPVDPVKLGERAGRTVVRTFRGPVRSRITRAVTMNGPWLGYQQLRLRAGQNINRSQYLRLEAARLCELAEFE